MTTVVKLGGSLLESELLRATALDAIASAWNDGQPLVIVHGGGKHIDSMLAKLGIAKKTHAGLRVTDDETLDVVVAALAGSVSKKLVSELKSRGISAVGISGADGSVVTASLHPQLDGVDLGHVGVVAHVDTKLIELLLGNVAKWPNQWPNALRSACDPNAQSGQLNADGTLASVTPSQEVTGDQWPNALRSACGPSAQPQHSGASASLASVTPSQQVTGIVPGSQAERSAFGHEGHSYLPVIGCVAISESGALLNVNADAVACAIASALKATHLVFLTDVDGVKDNYGQVVKKIDLAAAGVLMASGAIRGGMLPKLKASLDALQSGVSEVVIAGPSRHASVLFDGKGGTHLVAA